MPVRNMTDTRKGDWMQTLSGRPFWPLDPRVEDLLIDDIAHALSMICRFGGHCRPFYSVAEHSVLLSDALRPHGEAVALWGLLHDAAEAYVGDVTRPLKPSLYGFGEIEANIMRVIAERYRLGPMPPAVGDADLRILVDEKRQVMAESSLDWSALDGVEALGVVIQCWDPPTAKAEFLTRFRDLYLAVA